MRVLMLVRFDVERYAGGEATQVRETARALAELGIRSEISSDLAPDCTGYDLVHIFGITDPTEALVQARFARSVDIPVVLSPVYQNLTEYDSEGRHGSASLAYKLPPVVLEQLRSTAKYILSRRRGRRPLPWMSSARATQQRELLALSRLLLPNSELEQEAINRDFGIRVPFIVVPNGVSEHFAGGDITRFVRAHQLRDFVLAVGVITSLKNQLRLIKALESTELQLVLIGGHVATHAEYYRAVLRAVSRSNRVVLLPPMSQEKLADAYAAARVVALPSWFETCGMVALEGALAGCRVAITDRGYTAEYFGKEASYCQPRDLDSIRRAVVEAYTANEPQNLINRIKAEYTWRQAAARTAEGYVRALSQC